MNIQNKWKNVKTERLKFCKGGNKGCVFFAVVVQ